MGEGRLPGSGWQDLALAPGLRQPRLRSGAIAVLLRAGLDPPAPLFSSGARSPHLTPLFTPLRCFGAFGASQKTGSIPGRGEQRGSLSRGSQSQRPQS